MFCGPRCLKYVHEKHGEKLSQRRASHLCNTTRAGTFATDLQSALEELGYEVIIRDYLTWKQLKRFVGNSKNDVFVTWWSILDSAGGTPSKPDGHWCVALEITDTGNSELDIIKLYDPDPEEEIILPRKTFESLWFDYERLHGARKDFIRAAVIGKFKRSGGKITTGKP